MSRLRSVLISGTREWVRWKALDHADTLSECYGIPSKTADDSCIFCVFSDTRRCGMVGIGWSDGR